METRCVLCNFHEATCWVLVATVQPERVYDDDIDLERPYVEAQPTCEDCRPPICGNIRMEGARENDVVAIFSFSHGPPEL